MIRHVVLAKLSSTAAPAEIEAMFRQLSDLRRHMPGIVAFAAGADVSPEGLARGFTHGFTVDFVDRAARDLYLADPAHQAAGARLVALTEGGIDGLLVLDFAEEG